LTKNSAFVTKYVLVSQLTLLLSVMTRTGMP